MLFVHAFAFLSGARVLQYHEWATETNQVVHGLVVYVILL